jgi:eukaryotic-like serine/threonine-protein kinase
MSYCINPGCEQPQNTDGQERCKSCSSRLTLGDELQYRAKQPLSRKQGTQIYVVSDTQGREAILKVFDNSDRLVKLFERETEILQRLVHPGIPEFRSAFEFETYEGNQLHCLVMENVEGKNLEQWLSAHPRLEEGLALKWLRQLVEILSVVHRGGFLHQDIKPANILCKPNQQLVLIDFSNIPEIISAGFTPPEQADGSAVPSSDFFALGRTFIYLLTGIHPVGLPKAPPTQRLIWQNKAPQISQPFAALIDELIAPLPEQRPQDAPAILTRIDEIQEQRRSSPGELPPIDREPPPSQSSPKRTRLLAGTLGILGWGLAVIFAIPSIQQLISEYWSSPPSPPVCDAQLRDSISCGEESFLPDHSKNDQVPIQKKQGTDAFAAGKYTDAIIFFKKARKLDPSDPETLIYLNNARLAAQSKDAYTIATVAPLNTRRGLSVEALRGVAQVQDEINGKNLIHDKGLRVLVADDANDKDKAEIVADELVKRKDVLGVIGHYASEMTLAALPKYQEDSLVLVSYGSTSTDLSGYGFRKDHVFFRTVPTTQVSAISLASYLRGQSAYRKVAVFYNPNSPYSRSLRDWFQLSIKALGGVMLDRTDDNEIFNLCQDPFDAEGYQADIQRKNVTAIAIFPDGRVCDSSYQNAFDIIPNRKPSLPIMGSWIFMSDIQSRGIVPDKLEKFVGVAPWNRFSPQAKHSSFLRQADALWMKQNEFADDKVGVLTASTYDAAIVLTSAFRKLDANPNRTDIQKILALDNFQVAGATGNIQFMGGDLREPINHLFKIVPSKFCNSQDHSIVPIESPFGGSNVLDCSKLKSSS